MRAGAVSRSSSADLSQSILLQVILSVFYAFSPVLSREISSIVAAGPLVLPLIYS